MEKIKITLYVLELERGKYYVGQTSKPTFRYAEHIAALGSKWTKLYKAKSRPVCEERLFNSYEEAKLYENWLTLHWMQRKGWQNVRGGDFLKVEDYLLARDIEHIFDIQTGKIRYYVPSCPYLFGTCADWLIYILELEHGKYYIGSTKRLGRDLGKHFLGKSIEWTRLHKPIKVLTYFDVPMPNNYLEVKLKLLKEHSAYYGRDNVRGGNFEQKH